MLTVYVDGIPTFSDDFDWIAPQELEAVEVYSGLNVPIEYTSGANSCGVILLWTRR